VDDSIVERGRLIEAEPILVSEDSQWQSLRFETQSTLGNLINIAPFSVAQKQLFINFPGLLARAFSLGEHVNFCAAQRCVSLDQAGRTEMIAADRMFWRGIDVDHWANTYIKALAERNIYPLDTNGGIKADKFVTRGDFIRWAVEWYYGVDFERSQIIKRFKDLPEPGAMQDAINLLSKKGILNGYADGTIRSDQELTRAEAVKILLAMDNFTPSIEITNSNFSDLNGWVVPWVNEAYKRGMIQGYEDNTFKPQQSLTQGQAAKLIVLNQ